MHELSIALNILEIAEQEAGRRGAAQIVGIHVRLGPLAGVVKEALLFAYEVAREGTPLRQAQLVIEDVPIRAHCPTCRADRAVTSMQQLCCVACGTPTPDLVSGRELEVAALELQ